MLLLDGKKAVNRQERQQAVAGVDSFLGQCIDCDMLGQKTNVQIVVTKWDVVEKADESEKRFVESKLKMLSEKYSAKVGKIFIHRVAVHPWATAEIEIGFGMDQLITQWVDWPTFVHLREKPIQVVWHTEFDRYAFGRPSVPGIEGDSYE